MKSVVLLVLMLFAGCVNQTREGAEIEELTIRSPAFPANGNIPPKYTCQGDDVNPPLEIEGIPEGTVSLVIIVEDPDAAGGTWIHWVVFNIDPVTSIEEDTVPGKEGVNDFRRNSYGGPCPPFGAHRYFFIVYALDTTLDLDSSAGKEDVLKAMEGHILGRGELVGLFRKG